MMNLDWLKFSYNSITIAPVVIMNFIMLVFVLTMKKKTQASLWLAGVFAGYMLLYFGFFCSYAIYEPIGAYHRYLTTAVIYAAANLVGFSYYYPVNDRKKESAVVIFISFLIAIAFHSEFVYTTLKMEKYFDFTGHVYTFDYGSQAGIAIFALLIWAIVVLIRKTIGYSGYNGIFNSWRYPSANILKRLIASFFVGWIKLFFPSGDRAKASRAFIFSVLIYAAVGFFNLINKLGFIPYGLYAFLFNNFALIVTLLMLLTYLNYSQEPTSFMVKLIGITLGTVLLAFGFLGSITLDSIENNFDEKKAGEIKLLEKSIFAENYTELPDTIEYIILSRPEAEVLNRDYEVVYIKTPGTISQDTIKFDELAYRNRLAKEKTKSIRKLNPELKEEEISAKGFEELKKSRIYANLVNSDRIPFQRHYREIANQHYIHYDFINQEKRYEIGYSYSEYRKFIHKQAIQILYVIAGLTFVILILFPLFFRASLIVPLTNLLMGVEKVNKGKLNVEVKFKVLDEIGFLSSSFNSMVKSIKQARLELEDYAQNLEHKVNERTAELREKMEEVHTLKVQQDGDYFLTTLITTPLMQNRNKSKIVTIEFLIEQKKKFQFKGKQYALGGDSCISGNLNFDGRVYIMFFNGDAMGKSMQGAGGALVIGSVVNSIMARSASGGKVITNTSPTQWLEDAYYEVQRVMESFDGSMMVSCIMGLIEENTGKMYYFNAEHPFSILFRDKKAEYLEKEISAYKLGIPIHKGCKILSFNLQKGDIVFCGSDGKDDLLIEKEINQNGDLILELVEKANGDLTSLHGEILKKGELFDDLSIIKIEYNGHDEINEAGSFEEIHLKLNYPTVKIKEFIFGGDYEKALQELNHFDFHANEAAIFWKAYCLSKLKRNGEALALLETIESHLSDNKIGMKLIAKVYYDLGRWDEARSYLKRVTQLFPDDLSAKSLLQKLESRTG